MVPSPYTVYLSLASRAGLLFNYGEEIYEKDWDTLIVLDACRVDLMRELKDSYDFISDVDSTYSAGSMSLEWMEKNFSPEYSKQMSKTAYVTANPFSDRFLNNSDFEILDEVWRYAWDDDLGTIPARPVTERAIQISRNQDPNRLIVHYMQPHFPSVPSSEKNPPLPIEGIVNANVSVDSTWDKLRKGSVTKETVWKEYRDNLRYVLDDVEIILNNIDSKNVVLTSDHGNGIGEFGIYGHPKHVPLPSIKKVPWCVTSATNKETYTPTLEPNNSANDSDIQERLAALGYMG